MGLTYCSLQQIPLTSGQTDRSPTLKGANGATNIFCSKELSQSVLVELTKLPEKG